MKLLKKLYNPFALVGQGFALGAVLFFSTQPDGGDSLLDRFAAAPAAGAPASAI